MSGFFGAVSKRVFMVLITTPISEQGGPDWHTSQRKEDFRDPSITLMTVTSGISLKMT